MIGTTANNKPERSYSIPYFFNLARCIFNTKLSKLLLLVIAIIAIINFSINFLLTAPESGSLDEKDLNNRENHLRNVRNIEELERIKHSVSLELRQLESKRHKLQDEITAFQSQSITAEKESQRVKSDLESLKRQILQTKNERLEMLHQHPRLPPPARILPSAEDNIDIPAPKSSTWCRMYNCFDYSRCSLTSQFPVYVYPPSNSNGANAVWSLTAYMLDASMNAFLGNSYITSDPSIACLYIVIIGEVEPDSANTPKDVSVVQNWLSSLSYWRGDGRNHVIVHMSRDTTTQNLLLDINTGRAIVAQSSFQRTQFRNGFDIILPSLASTSDKVHVLPKSDDSDEEAFSVPQVPITRSYFITFVGQIPSSEDTGNVDDSTNVFHSTLLNMFKEMSEKEKHGKVHFQTSCDDNAPSISGLASEWSLCGSTESRLTLLSKSTFSLIITPDDIELTSTSLLVTRLAESLYSGAVPVIIGTQVELPFNEYVDWTKAAILWPKARTTELDFLLSSYPHSDISALRRQGKFVYDTYFTSAKVILDSMLATVRTRIGIPPLPVQDEISTTVGHKSYVFDKEVAPGDAQSEFGLPPPEGKIDSPKFTRNFTFVTLDAKDLWNKVPGPFQLYPSTPFERVLPSDAKFLGSSAGFKPIGEGLGGVGEVYQESLGGNVPREQFTIVMLTYEREEVMLQSVHRLKGLPFLNKVIVVWNSPGAPADDLLWPDIGVEVAVVRPKRNSLNNRFLPFNEIETDAVLSIDDDAHLRHDEILFSFRVWREQRDRVVGFPGRHHAWDISNNEWRYNSNYCCELSMVLTGAAFVHKYYLYLYSYWMPQEVRDKVDELMNCEDIAMNFLVSHLTREPPVKVTSRWTFRCPGCPEALSNDQSHFEERHVCINYFVKIFGYMPLLTTQFRVDSILFKTKLPHDKQKCFKFI